MVLTFWGCSKRTAFFIGNETSRPKVIRTGLEAVNYLLLVGATILAAYSFMLLHQIFHDFTITVAMIMAFIVMFVTAIAVVYKLWQILNSQEEHFTLKVQGTWTKVSRGSWVKLKDQEVTQAMLTSDHYIHSRKRGGRSVIGQGVIAASMLAAGDSGVSLHALRYATSVVQNPGGPQVFASQDETKLWLSQSSVADQESATCCDTDDSGCFLCCRNCNFKYKSFSTQANMAFISLLQFSTIAYALSGKVYVGYGSEDSNYDPTLLLIVSGTEVLVLIISAFISFLITTDLKCCFCCCINISRQCRHGGTYINLLNEIVISAFTQNDIAVKDPPAITSADNAVSLHPKYVKDYLRIKCGSEEEDSPGAT